MPRRAHPTPPHPRRRRRPGRRRTAAVHRPGPVLTGRAVLPAGTFASDPPSGARITGSTNGVPFEKAGVSIGDFQLADRHTGLVLERANGQGPTAQFKTVEQITLGRGDGHVVEKTPVLDELKIWDPAGISRFAPPNRPGNVLPRWTFGLPFQTIESLEILDRHQLLVGVDDNPPSSLGRPLATGTPDDREFAKVWLCKGIG